MMLGDENSLAGQTKAHKHSAVSSDGGFLETSTTGMTNLSEGSIIQGDASSIQTELSLGTPSQELKVNSGGTALEYFTPSGGSTWTMISEVTSAGTSVDTGAHSACDNYQELSFNCFFIATSTDAIEVQFYGVDDNLHTSAHYQINGTYGGTAFQNNDTTSARPTNDIAIGVEGVCLQIRMFNKKGAGCTGGSYSVATYNSGGSGSIYNRGMSACSSGVSCPAIRGFKIISGTMSNAYWNLLGA